MIIFACFGRIRFVPVSWDTISSDSAGSWKSGVKRTSPMRWRASVDVACNRKLKQFAAFVPKEVVET